MNKRVITILAITAILVIISVLKLSKNKKTVEGKLYIHDTEAAIFVEVEKPSNHTFENSFSYLGTFEPFRQNTIGSDGSGKVVKLGFQEGDKISEGQFLIKLDDEMINIQLESAEINVEGQRNDDARNTNLIKENAVSGVQIEKTKLALKSAETQVRQIKKQLRNTSLSAPFSGVVTKKMVDIGSVVGPGTPVLELTDISSLKLNISVPERDILKFKKGQGVSVKVDVYGNQLFSGKISNIGIKADASHNFKVEILLKNSTNSPILAGMYGSVILGNSKTTTALSIPRSALIGSSKQPRVYVVRNGKSKLISFTAGTSDGDFIEVVDGLNKNDVLVVKGQINIENNSNVVTK
jgi:RND family efflux transporter MFP subunit